MSVKSKKPEEIVVKCSWGRIGNALQNKEFKFEKQKEAVEFMTKKINDKKRKGYEMEI